MPITSQDREYPICDTDLWIKVSKLNNLNLIYNNHNKIFISDAVRQELENKSKDSPLEFIGSLESLKKKYKDEKVLIMRLDNPKIFNKDERAAVEQAFAEFEIHYDKTNNKFIGRQKNLGERVSAIYASVHGLTLILSDDGELNKFLSTNYSYIAVKNLKDLLYDYGYEHNEINKIINELRGGYSEIAATEVIEKIGNKFQRFKTKNKF